MEKMDRKKIILGGSVLILALVSIFILHNFKTYTVTFDSKMGTSIKAQEVKVNQTAEKPKDPIMTGYIFEGWYLNDEEFDFNTKITEDITLTGKWKEISE